MAVASGEKIIALTTATPVQNINSFWFSMQSLRKFRNKKALNRLEVTVHNVSWNRPKLSAMIIVLCYFFQIAKYISAIFSPFALSKLILILNKNVKCCVILPLCYIKLHMLK